MASRIHDKRLMREIRCGDLEGVKEQLGDGADPNKLVKSLTPLMLAAYHGHLEIVELLLARGADPNKRSGDGGSALYWACNSKHEDIAWVLLAAGAEANAVRTAPPPPERPGPSVLNAAIHDEASVALVQELVRAGASVDHRYLGKGMIEYATWCERLDLVPVLKQTERRPRK